MVDTSSSMNTTVDGSSKSRIEVLRESLTNLISQFQAEGADGEPQDIRVAVADFNGYTEDSNSRYYQADEDHLSGASIRGRGTDIGLVYTGSRALNAEAFVDVNSLSDTAFNSINTYSGTNYDYAFDAVYQLGKAILTRNAQDGEERDLFVIFMSDGAPFQYNYFSSNSDTANWNNWLQGTVTENMWDSNAHNYFYNDSGNKHRMAEAIKGDPDASYTVIRKDSTDNYGEQQYMTRLPGLGATMYSIGFCLEQDSQITVASMEYVLKNISSDSEKFYYKVNTADELNSAFAAIGNEIAYAATNARFVDTMGANYNLQMKSSTYKLSDGTTDTITPEITVQAYDIYTAADGVAESEIGKRKGTSTVLETVTFNEDGTQAFSDKIGGGATNILTGGVICANTFWYNTTGSAVSIDTDGDGTNDYSLAPETFYWKMGTINQTELALSYYVYLTGSVDGTRAVGSYPTNESATLYYTNWLGNEAKKDTVSPVLAWKSANVSYAFYLVNENGEIIVNKATGLTGSFANKVAVTNPVVYSEVLLNSAENVQADIVASGVLPEGYALYDTTAAYNVRINSNSTGGWTITKGTETATTYVTEYGGDPTTELSTENSGYDYTHTVVWFAVKYQISCVPDAVVIDFGLPVDISVLANDILGEGAAVKGLAVVDSIPAAQGTEGLAAGFSTGEYTGTYGTATINGTKVRYTPSSMKMDNTEKFSYAAQANLANDKNYYYSTVTVIPAANIYYEDSFVTFSDGWTSDGQAKDGITQQEDRPGQFSLSTYDANNVYGYDAAYTDCTTYSLGSARKVTVTKAMVENWTESSAWPTATFTFKGTGFDVISLTDNTSGAIFVDVYAGKDTSGTRVKSYIVDNYYGYKTVTDDAGNTTWVVDVESTDCLYQIPVMKITGLAYDEYTAVVTVFYDGAFDHTTNNSYSFWLDAIRVYDPMGVDIPLYTQDNEGYPQYIKLRDKLAKKDGVTADVVFIDGGNTANIAIYANYGPNNEVYLANGQAISFTLSGDLDKVATVQIGAKAPSGTAKMVVNNGAPTEISTATEMYYKLNVSSGNSVTITNTGDGILSLTNLKITFSSKDTVTLVTPSAEAQTFAVKSVRALFAAAPVEPEPEPTFAPERFEAAWNRSTVRAGQKATLTVKTSEDVEAVMVDGVTINTYRTRTQRTGWGQNATKVTYREFTYTITAPETADYAITAVNAEGIASEPITAALTVQAASQRPGFGGWLDKIFSRWF